MKEFPIKPEDVGRFKVISYDITGDVTSELSFDDYSDAASHAVDLKSGNILGFFPEELHRVIIGEEVTLPRDGVCRP
jgi:hypothetical protein